MENNTKRQITWVIVIGIVAALIVVVVHRRTAVDRAIAQLDSSSPAQRVEAVGKLINSGKLADALQNQPRWIQDQAVAAVGRIGTPQALRQLVATIPEFDKPVADEATAYLVQMGVQAVGPMAQSLYHKDALVKRAARTVLGNIGSPAVPALLDMLDVYDEDARIAAMVALIIMGEPAVDPLIKVLKRTEPQAEQSPAAFIRGQETAYGALNGMKATSIAAIMQDLLGHKQAKVRETGAGLLGDIIDQSCKFFEHPARAEPIQLLTPIPLEEAEKTVAPLIDRLRNDPHWRVRRQAALALGRLLTAGDQPRIINALVNHLGDPHVKVKAASVTALGQIGAIRVAPILVNTLMNNRAGAGPELKIALRRLGSSAISALSPALTSSNAEIRQLATETLSGIGSRLAVVPLAERLRDRDLAVRRQAAETLAGMSAGMLVPTANPEVVANLLTALDDPNWQVYHQVRIALSNIGPAAVPALIDKLSSADLRGKYMAQKALADIGSPAIAPLVGALGSSSGELRHWAAVALGKIGPDIIGSTARLLGDPAASTASRVAAARALGYTGSPAATERLNAAAGSGEKELRIAVLRAFNDIRDPQATETLVAALEDTDMQVRDVALALLKQWQFGDVTELLNKLLNTEDENARRRAAIIIAYHTSPAATPLLAEVRAGVAEAAEANKIVKILTAAIEDTNADSELRRQAVENLGTVATPAAVSVLEPLLAADSPFVTQAAQSVAQIGLRAITGTGAEVPEAMGRAAQLLTKTLKEAQSDTLRTQLCYALAQMKALPVSELLEGLGKYPDELKPWAASTLAAIGEPAVEPTLSIRGSSEDHEQRLWCVAVLIATGNRQAKRLIKYLPKDEIPKEARTTLVQQMQSRIMGYE